MYYISLSLGELILKGKNRQSFVHKLRKDISRVLKDESIEEIYQEMGKIYIKTDKDQIQERVKKLKHLFGIVYISPCIRVDKDLDSMKKASIDFVEDYLKDHPSKTFKVESSRADKQFALKSPELNQLFGAAILQNIQGLSVDVHHPDFHLYCDVKKYVYFYIDKIKAYGGLPMGTNGRGLLLLSGGIDSPVAGFLMGKRGVQIDAVHFHSYPFTSPRGEEKVKELARILSTYTGRLTLYSINLLEIQKAINKNCPYDEMTILSRRFMMRIAQKICDDYSYDSMITGENLGQVASQTIHGLTVSQDAVHSLVFRPLIGLDKVDIIKISEEIGTYETSIQPFEDCCTVFLPKHPVLKPTGEQMEKSEGELDVESLVNEAVKSMKVYHIS